MAKTQIVQQPRAVRHLSTSVPTALPFATLCPKLEKKQCRFPLTSQAAAIGRIYFSAIYFESPAPRDVNIGRFFDIDYVWGSGARDAKEVGDISAIEASLKQRERANFIKHLRYGKAMLHFCTSLSPAITPEHIFFSFKVSFQGFQFSGSLDVSEKLNRYYKQHGCIFTHLCIYICTYVHIDLRVYVLSGRDKVRKQQRKASLTQGTSPPSGRWTGCGTTANTKFWSAHPVVPGSGLARPVLGTLRD